MQYLNFARKQSVWTALLSLTFSIVSGVTFAYASGDISIIPHTTLDSSSTNPIQAGENDVLGDLLPVDTAKNYAFGAFVQSPGALQTDFSMGLKMYDEDKLYISPASIYTHSTISDTISTITNNTTFTLTLPTPDASWCSSSSLGGICTDQAYRIVGFYIDGDTNKRPDFIGEFIDINSSTLTLASGITNEQLTQIILGQTVVMNHYSPFDDAFILIDNQTLNTTETYYEATMSGINNGSLLNTPEFFTDTEYVQITYTNHGIDPTDHYAEIFGVHFTEEFIDTADCNQNLSIAFDTIDLTQTFEIVLSDTQSFTNTVNIPITPGASPNIIAHSDFKTLYQATGVLYYKIQSTSGTPTLVSDVYTLTITQENCFITQDLDIQEISGVFVLGNTLTINEDINGGTVEVSTYLPAYFETSGGYTTTSSGIPTIVPTSPTISGGTLENGYKLTWTLTGVIAGDTIEFDSILSSPILEYVAEDFEICFIGESSCLNNPNTEFVYFHKNTIRHAGTSPLFRGGNEVISPPDAGIKIIGRNGIEASTYTDIVGYQEEVGIQFNGGGSSIVLPPANAILALENILLDENSFDLQEVESNLTGSIQPVTLTTPLTNIEMEHPGNITAEESQKILFPPAAATSGSNSYGNVTFNYTTFPINRKIIGDLIAFSMGGVSATQTIVAAPSSHKVDQQIEKIIVETNNLGTLTGGEHGVNVWGLNSGGTGFNQGSLISLQTFSWTDLGSGVFEYIPSTPISFDQIIIDHDGATIINTVSYEARPPIHPSDDYSTLTVDESPVIRLYDNSNNQFPGISLPTVVNNGQITFTCVDDVVGDADVCPDPNAQDVFISISIPSSDELRMTTFMETYSKFADIETTIGSTSSLAPYDYIFPLENISFTYMNGGSQFLHNMDYITRFVGEAQWYRVNEFDGIPQGKIRMSWETEAAPSSLQGFSFSFSEGIGTSPDGIVEIDTSTTSPSLADCDFSANANSMGSSTFEYKLYETTATHQKFCTEYFVDGTTNGKYIFKLKAIDTNGTPGNTINRIFFVDNTLPNIVAEDPATLVKHNGWHNEYFSHHFIFDDFEDVNGINRSSGLKTGSDNVSESIEIARKKFSGPHPIAYQNMLEEDTVNTDVAAFLADLPSLPLTEVLDNNIYDNSPDTGKIEYVYSMNDNSGQTGGGQYDGIYYFVGKVVDNAFDNGTNQQLTNFTIDDPSYSHLTGTPTTRKLIKRYAIDTLAPNVTDNLATQAWHTISPLSITIHVDDNTSGPDDIIEYTHTKHTGNPLGTPINVAPTEITSQLSANGTYSNNNSTFSSDIQISDNGKHTLTNTVTKDKAGNETIMNFSDIRIDSLPPKFEDHPDSIDGVDPNTLLQPTTLTTALGNIEMQHTGNTTAQESVKTLFPSAAADTGNNSYSNASFIYNPLGNFSTTDTTEERSITGTFPYSPMLGATTPSTLVVTAVGTHRVTQMNITKITIDTNGLGTITGGDHSLYNWTLQTSGAWSQGSKDSTQTFNWTSVDIDTYEYIPTIPLSVDEIMIYHDSNTVVNNVSFEASPATIPSDDPTTPNIDELPEVTLYDSNDYPFTGISLPVNITNNIITFDCINDGNTCPDPSTQDVYVAITVPSSDEIRFASTLVANGNNYPTDLKILFASGSSIQGPHNYMFSFDNVSFTYGGASNTGDGDDIPGLPIDGSNGNTTYLSNHNRYNLDKDDLYYEFYLDDVDPVALDHAPNIGKEDEDYSGNTTSNMGTSYHRYFIKKYTSISLIPDGQSLFVGATNCTIDSNNGNNPTNQCWSLWETTTTSPYQIPYGNLVYDGNNPTTSGYNCIDDISTENVFSGRCYTEPLEAEMSYVIYMQGKDEAGNESPIVQVARYHHGEEINRCWSNGVCEKIEDEFTDIKTYYAKPQIAGTTLQFSELFTPEGSFGLDFDYDDEYDFAKLFTELDSVGTALKHKMSFKKGSSNQSVEFNIVDQTIDLTGKIGAFQTNPHINPKINGTYTNPTPPVYSGSLSLDLPILLKSNIHKKDTNYTIEQNDYVYVSKNTYDNIFTGGIIPIDTIIKYDPNGTQNYPYIGCLNLYTPRTLSNQIIPITGNTEFNADCSQNTYKWAYNTGTGMIDNLGLQKLHYYFQPSSVAGVTTETMTLSTNNVGANYGITEEAGRYELYISMSAATNLNQYMKILFDVLPADPDFDCSDSLCSRLNIK